MISSLAELNSSPGQSNADWQRKDSPESFRFLAVSRAVLLIPKITVSRRAVRWADAAETYSQLRTVVRSKIKHFNQARRRLLIGAASL